MACQPESVNGGKDASSTNVLVWLSQVLPGVQKVVDQAKAHAPVGSSTAARPSARGRPWFWSAQPNQILTIRTDRFGNRSSDHGVAGSSPAGCMPQPETHIVHVPETKKLACAFIRLHWRNSKGELETSDGTGFRIPLGLRTPIPPAKRLQ
jgi:hypothetical protein